MEWAFSTPKVFENGELWRFLKGFGPIECSEIIVHKVAYFSGQIALRPFSHFMAIAGLLEPGVLGERASPDCGKSEGSDYAHHITTCYSNFQTFLRPCHCMDQILAWHSFDKTEEFICQQKRGNFWHWHWIVMYYLFFYKEYYALLPLHRAWIKDSYKTRVFQSNNFSYTDYQLL